MADQTEVCEGEEYCCPAEFEEMEPMRKMFIGNIPKDATDDEVKAAFPEELEVEDFAVVRRDGNPKIFGFITFTKCDSVDECLKKRPLKVKNRELQVKRAVPKDDQSDTAHYRTKKIFFANVTPETTEEDVRSYLEKRHPPKYGKIEEVILVKKKDETTKEATKEHKGYGFIVCENEDLADRISIGDRKCKVLPTADKEQEFKKARPKEGGAGGRGGRGGGRGGARGGRGAAAVGYGGYGGGYGGYGGWGAYSGYGGGWGNYGGWGW